MTPEQKLARKQERRKEAEESVRKEGGGSHFYGLASRSDELRMWLILSGALNMAFFITLVNSDRPLTVIGVMFLIHLLVSMPTAFAFHRTAVSEALMGVQSTNDTVDVYEPPCEGMFGSGGTKQAFLCYVAFFVIQSYRLGLVYTTCALSTYRVKLDSVTYMQMTFAFIFLFASVVFIEIGKRSRSARHSMFYA